jgi:hypothetical protein
MHPEISRLVCDILDFHDERYGMGTMTCSVYDTAWVANVYKTVGGIPQYLFPSSFFAILRAQSEDGGWVGHFSGETEYTRRSPLNLPDSILSTMASLYALTLKFELIRYRRLPWKHASDVLLSVWD